MNTNERLIVREIAKRLALGKAYRGLFNLLHLETQQALAARVPALVEGDAEPAEREPNIKAVEVFVEEVQG